jgi:CubicO group peptidase (beta-lactamase class C family)
MVLRDRTNLAEGTPTSSRLHEDPAPVPADVRAGIRQMMQAARIPGLSIAVVDREGLLAAEGFGHARLDGAVPATPQTSYLWFSMSKIVTASATMRLVDEGRLDLDAPLSEYLDYPGPRSGAQPSTRHLLSHTAGLGNPLPLRWVHPARETGTDPDRAADLSHRLLTRRRAFRYPVGGSARYSNVGYLALGAVIQAVAGVPFETYAQQAVLDPCGMRHTGFASAPGRVSATGYVRAPRGSGPVLRTLLPHGIVAQRHKGYLALAPFHVDGPAYGGVVGDVLDAARFLRMHLRDGEADDGRVLTPAAARLMRRIDQPGRPFEHGLGWFRRPTDPRGAYVEHFGAGAGFWNVMRLYPGRGLGIAVMTNSTSGYDFEPLFARITEAPWSSGSAASR